MLRFCGCKGGEEKESNGGDIRGNRGEGGNRGGEKSGGGKRKGEGNVIGEVGEGGAEVEGDGEKENVKGGRRRQKICRGGKGELDGS